MGEITARKISVFGHFSRNGTYSVKSVFLKTSPQACNFFKKETLVQVFSCEFCEISKSTFFYRTPLVAVSVQR